MKQKQTQLGPEVIQALKLILGLDGEEPPKSLRKLVTRVYPDLEGTSSVGTTKAYGRLKKGLERAPERFEPFYFGRSLSPDREEYSCEELRLLVQIRIKYPYGYYTFAHALKASFQKVGGDSL